MRNFITKLHLQALITKFILKLRSHSGIFNLKEGSYITLCRNRTFYHKTVDFTIEELLLFEGRIGYMAFLILYPYLKF
jgi:hypothetical protein